jgi:broad specificity phosphatase PhoE
MCHFIIFSFTHIVKGACDGMTYEEIEEVFPEEFERREGDKLAYRYPR